MSDPTWIGAGVGDTVGNGSIDTSGLVTLTAHGLIEGQPIMIDNRTGGATPAFETNTVYYVADPELDPDEFFVAYAPGGPIVTPSSSGTMDVHTAVPHYSAAELRRADAVTLYGGTSDAFGARQGVRPGHTPVSVSGTTWTVEHVTAVVYPGLSSTDGPYRVQHESESGSLDPADGSNDRIDALDLQIQDDDADASGFRRARVVYVTGTPASSPSAPSVTSNSLRLATIDVPAGGTPSPSVDTLAQWTVASGGVLPVRDATELPSSGTYDGMTAWDQDEGALKVDDGTGSGWEEVARRNPPVMRLRKSATQSISDSSFTDVTFDVEDFDAHGFHSPGSAFATPTVPGVYRIYGRVEFAINSSGNRAARLLVDGGSTELARVTLPAASTVTAVQVSALWEFDGDGSDGVHMDAFQDSGGSLDVRGPATHSSVLEMEYVRPPL